MVVEPSQARISPKLTDLLPTLLVGLVCSYFYVKCIPTSHVLLAKSLVAAGLARRALVQLSYAIGVAEPLSVYVDTYGTGRMTQ